MRPASPLRSIALDIRHLDREAEEIMASALYAITVTLGVSVLVSLAYIAKSALGINLLPGQSPLHELLFHFVR